MPKIVPLSYALSSNTPVYPGDEPVFVKAVRQISRGDTCNTSSIAVSSHAGTHMDVPYHFFEKGRRMDGCDPDGFVFKHPYMVDCPKKPGEAIGPADIAAGDNAKKADIVIVRTGFGKYRLKNKSIYCYENPYFLPETAEYIIKSFPKIRALGIDTLSVSSKKNSSLGKDTHKILLGKGIVIIEDMRLSGKIEDFTRIVAFPLFASSPDGSPCVVMGMRDD